MDGVGRIDLDLLRLVRRYAMRRRMRYRPTIVFAVLVVLQVGALLALDHLGVRPWQDMSPAAVSP